MSSRKVQEEVDDNNKIFPDRSLTFIADYTQILEVLFFGESQPGDMYYFTPLKVNVFGVVNCFITGGSLGAHVYNEGQSKKKGNNIASMLIEELFEKKLLNETVPRKELTVIMDSCRGRAKIILSSGLCFSWWKQNTSGKLTLYSALLATSKTIQTAGSTC